MATNLGKYVYNYLRDGSSSDPFVAGKRMIEDCFDVVVGGMSMGGGIAQVMVYDLIYQLAHPNFGSQPRIYYSVLAPSRGMRVAHVNELVLLLGGNNLGTGNYGWTPYGGWYKVGVMGGK